MRPRFWVLAGLCTSVLGAITVGWLFGLPELTALAVAVGAVALFCGLHLWLGPPTPDVGATVSPRAVPRGEPARLTLHFSNPRGLRTRPVTVSGGFGTAGNGLVALAPLRPNGTTEVAIDVPTPERGLVQFGPMRLRATDPLGVWRRDTHRPLESVLVVHPRVHQLPGLFHSGRMQIGSGRPTSAMHGGPDAEVDLVGLRPYVPGDDLRRIHWRTSARRNQPHVVQVEPPVGPVPVAVVVDTRSRSCTPDRFELAVEAAASICSAAATTGRPVRLTTTAGTDTHCSATPSGLSEALDTLARVGQGNTGDLASVLTMLEPMEHSIVICTGDPAVAHDPAIPTGSLVVCWDGTTALSDAFDALPHRAGPIGHAALSSRVDGSGQR